PAQPPETPLPHVRRPQVRLPGHLCLHLRRALRQGPTDWSPLTSKYRTSTGETRWCPFTKLAHIEVYGQTVVISRDYVGKVLVNGLLLNLPHRLEEDKLVVYRSGGGATLVTDFGLRVTYDWRTRITVSLPSTYGGSVCGLCGNFDGNGGNDLTKKGGATATRPAELGQSWQAGTAPGCAHECQGQCPQCDNAARRRFEGPEFCGLLRDPAGPFRDCQSHLDPADYFEDCAYDACLYKGQHTVLCQAVGIYAAACQDAGLTVHQWRGKEFCPMTCPANSHYEVCGSGCPVSCASLLGPVECDAPCSEGCQCDEGHVLSGERCVPLAECGCLHRQAYYSLGEVFFPGSKCAERCQCLPSGALECQDHRCGKYEECKVVKGEAGCHPVDTGTCSAAGDPHYRSFDGLAFDFQGTCTYTLATVLQEDERLPSFTVNVENESYGNGKVAVTRLVEVVAHGHKLILEQNVRSTVKLNGVTTNLPLTVDGGKVRAYQHGNKAVVETDFGLAVRYDLIYYVTVTVPGNYRGRMGGLCGNFNDQRSDDYTLRDGKTTRDVTAFGKSWSTSVRGSKCSWGCGTRCPSCPPKKLAVFRQDNYCSFLGSAHSALAPCYEQLDPGQFRLDCLYDICQSNGDITVLCTSIQAYASACQGLKVDLKPWRNESFCPMKCPANSHYSVCANTCATTCAGITDLTSCPETCAEGCQCDDGFFADGEQCVSIEKCGCFENGHYYQPDEVSIQPGCKQKCTCSIVGLYCEDIACASDEQCEVKKGVLGCYNKDPCKAAKCRVKETCKVESGVAGCVPEYTGRCWAWGDPHYRTFDNVRFDFQGTCTYTMAETCGPDFTLTPFSIEAKNDLRGSTAVSYVKLVHINVYGHKISIHKAETGRVRVDDVRTSLPVTLADGKLRLYQSGTFALLETDFGLKVSYDWKWYLIVDLPSSYFSNMCGLCGNFNGKADDEQTTRNGTQASSTLEWAGSWKVDDHDLFCLDYCRGYCPTCSDKERRLYEGEQHCGILRHTFQPCHAKVDHQPFFDSCVYDVCLNQGLKSMLCQALAAYASECQKEGVTITGWRKAASCPLECPANSHYEECGSACTPTCTDRGAAKLCTAPCVESCQCSAGHVLVEAACVPLGSCGCTYQGLYYKPGESFWADGQCRQRCVCDADLAMVVCKETGCKASERCGLVDGVRGCQPISYSTCSASGDPHYNTFDGVRYDFMGTCIYKLSGLCAKGSGLTPFEVRVQNDHRGSTRVSYTTVVTVEVYSTNITLSVEQPRRIAVNGLLATLPFYLDTDRISAYSSGWTGVVQTDFGLTVTFDWQSHVSVTLPATYGGAVCGLCGNFDGKSDGELRLPGGRAPVAPDVFGAGWKAADRPGCVSGCGAACPACARGEEAEYSRDTHCGLVSSPTGPFRDCHAAVEHARFFRDCLYDVCHFRGLRRTLCDALGLYTAACQQAGATVHPWRTDKFCPAVCPEHAHYQLCGTGCPPTCYGLTSPPGCRAPCKEACQCDDGYLLSGEQCVPLSQCGCADGGVYRQKDEVFYRDGGCEQRCVCRGDGRLECAPAGGCRAGEHCAVSGGVRACRPSGHAQCVASGDPHYTTFDGLRFDFQGTCTYTLSKLVARAPGLQDFAVQVENVKWGNGRVAVTRLVVVHLYGHRFSLEQGVRWKVKVDGELFNLPFQLRCGRVKVAQEGNKLVLRAEFGLKVTYDAKYYVALSVPSTYQGKVGGLCGNYNGHKTDELTLPGGTKTSDVTEFGAGWKVFVEGAQCNDGCGANCPTCGADKTAAYSKADKCGFIKQAGGPLAACHATVSPDQFFDNCLYDLCVAEGDSETLCDGLQAYATACQEAGVHIQSWRAKDFCPLSCPANSHYELCAETCETNCAAIIAPVACDGSCSEGCQCNDGFSFSGDQCVPIETCGCVYQGRYFQVDEETLTADCEEHCTCYATGAVLCEKAGCGHGEVCRLRAGARGCYREGKCLVGQDQQLTGFDGSSGQVMQAGAYELATVCAEDSDTWFRILADFRPCGAQGKLGVAAIYLYFKGAFIVVTKDKSVWVNGRPVREDQLPFNATGGVSVRAEAGVVMVEHPSKVSARLAGLGELTVNVADSFSGQLCGACGNFDGSTDNELRLPDGKIAADIQHFLRAWVAREFSG
uniref:IgGFc-binding protein-like n=1 Tax=Pristiophorus japonicus TaxID=55135 RepID=UPI00398F5435